MYLVIVFPGHLTLLFGPDAHLLKLVDFLLLPRDKVTSFLLELRWFHSDPVPLSYFHIVQHFNGHIY
jgi:hypothetical protein